MASLARSATEPFSPGGKSFRPTLFPSDLERLWTALMLRPWVSLAVVCPEDGRTGWRLIQEVAAVATRGQSRRVRALNALQAPGGRATAIAHALARAAASSRDQTRYLLAVDSPLVTPAGGPILAACDAVLLVLHRGQTRLADARRTADLIGRERLVGAVLQAR
jgi:hypothetical protein